MNHSISIYKQIIQQYEDCLSRTLPVCRRIISPDRKVSISVSIVFATEFTFKLRGLSNLLLNLAIFAMDCSSSDEFLKLTFGQLCDDASARPRFRAPHSPLHAYICDSTKNLQQDTSLISPKIEAFRCPVWGAGPPLGPSCSSRQGLWRDLISVDCPARSAFSRDDETCREY